MHELLAHGFAEVAQEALFDVGPFVSDPDWSPGGSDKELHDDRRATRPSARLADMCYAEPLGLQP